jgi:hypothetical protein
MAVNADIAISQIVLPLRDIAPNRSSVDARQFSSFHGIEDHLSKIFMGFLYCHSAKFPLMRSVKIVGIVNELHFSFSYILRYRSWSSQSLNPGSFFLSAHTLLF